MESPSLRPPAATSARQHPTGPRWSRSPRFWLLAAAGGSLILAVGSAIEAARIEPVRLGFTVCAITFLLAALGCAAAALRGPRLR